MTASHASHRLKPGHVVLGYRVLRELGSRESPVYAAYRVVEERADLAVLQQFPRPHGAASQLTGILRDARAVAEVEHLSLMRVYRAAPIGEEVVVASAFIEGETYASLGSLARERQARIPLDVHVRLLLQTLAGLAALHRTRDARRRPLGLFHGCLSPADVVVGLDGAARVVGVLHAQPRRVSPDEPYRGYLAPEVLAGDHPVDRRADVYAMGVMLWEALAGERLFANMSSEQILSRQQRSPIERPQLSGEPAWAAGCADVALRALSADVEGRFASADEMANALKARAQIAKHATAVKLIRQLAGESISRRRKGLAALMPPDLELDDEAVTAVASRTIPESAAASAGESAGPGPASSIRSGARAKTSDSSDSSESTESTEPPISARKTRPETMASELGAARDDDEEEEDEEEDEDTTQLGPVRPRTVTNAAPVDADEDAETLRRDFGSLVSADLVAPSPGDPPRAAAHRDAPAETDDDAVTEIAPAPAALLASSSLDEIAAPPPAVAEPAVFDAPAGEADAPPASIPTSPGSRSVSAQGEHAPLALPRAAIVEVEPISEQDALDETLPVDMALHLTVTSPASERGRRQGRGGRGRGTLLGVAAACALALVGYVVARASSSVMVPKDATSWARAAEVRTRAHRRLEHDPPTDALAPAASTGASKGPAAPSSPAPRKNAPRPWFRR